MEEETNTWIPLESQYNLYGETKGEYRNNKIRKPFLVINAKK